MPKNYENLGSKIANNQLIAQNVFPQNFSFFEGLQAILHTIFAAGTFILAILFAKKGSHSDRNEENPWEIEEKSAVGKSGNGGTQTNYSGYNLMDKENYVSNGRETVGR